LIYLKSIDINVKILSLYDWRATYTPVSSVATMGTTGYAMSAQMYSPAGARTGYEQTYPQTPQTTANSSTYYSARPQVLTPS